MVGVLTAIIAGLLSGLGEPLLRTWLGNGLEVFSLWLLFKMVVVPFYASGGVMAYVYRAWNKVKAPALWTVFIGVVDICTIVSFLKIYEGEYALEIMLALSDLFSIAQCYVLNNICVNILYPGNGRRSWWMGIRVFIVFLISYFCGWLIDYCFDIGSLFIVALSVLFSGAFLLCIACVFFFNQKERNLLFSIVR